MKIIIKKNLQGKIGVNTIILTKMKPMMWMILKKELKN